MSYHYVELVDVFIGPNMTKCYRCPVTATTFAFMKALERCNFGCECRGGRPHCPSAVDELQSYRSAAAAAWPASRSVPGQYRFYTP